MKTAWWGVIAFCAVAGINASTTHAQSSNSSTPPDGWGKFKFGMSQGQVNDILKRDGDIYIIDNITWKASVRFANVAKIANNSITIDHSPSAGNLDEIILTIPQNRDVYPCYPDQIVSELERRYGAFQITPGPPQDYPGRRPMAQPYAVKRIGQVTIIFDFSQAIPRYGSNEAVLGVECVSPAIIYHMYGLEAVPPSKPRPPPRRGQF